MDQKNVQIILIKTKTDIVSSLDRWQKLCSLEKQNFLRASKYPV